MSEKKFRFVGSKEEHGKQWEIIDKDETIIKGMSEFKKKLRDFRDAAQRLLDYWYTFDADLSDFKVTLNDFVKGYPFTEDFDEMVGKIWNWEEEMRELYRLAAVEYYNDDIKPVKNIWILRREINLEKDIIIKRVISRDVADVKFYKERTVSFGTSGERDVGKVKITEDDGSEFVITNAILSYEGRDET